MIVRSSTSSSTTSSATVTDWGRGGATVRISIDRGRRSDNRCRLNAWPADCPDDGFEDVGRHGHVVGWSAVIERLVLASISGRSHGPDGVLLDKILVPLGGSGSRILTASELPSFHATLVLSALVYLASLEMESSVDHVVGRVVGVIMRIGADAAATRAILVLLYTFQDPARADLDDIIVPFSFRVDIVIICWEVRYVLRSH
jgi:hypothetical protein